MCLVCVLPTISVSFHIMHAREGLQGNTFDIAGGLVGQGNERYVGPDCHEAEYNDHNYGLGGIAGDARP